MIRRLAAVVLALAVSGPAQGNRVVPQSQDSSFSLLLILPPCYRGFSPYFSTPDGNVRFQPVLRNTTYDRETVLA